MKQLEHELSWLSENVFAFAVWSVLIVLFDIKVTLMSTVFFLVLAAAFFIVGRVANVIRRRRETRLTQQMRETADGGPYGRDM